jgi:hypothetical protein
MDLLLHIPDDFAAQLSAGGNIEREALEALALESYRAGRLTKSELRRLLGFGSQPRLDAFLVSHDVFGTYTEQDLARDRQDLQAIGL